MDTRTGEIFELDEQTAREKRLTPLSPREYQAMLGVPQEERPFQLALARFVAEREKLRAPATIPIKNAFRQGYRAALIDQNGGPSGQ